MTKRAKRQIEYTLATHAVEKLLPSQEALQLCEEISNGTMDANAAVSLILEQHGLKRA